MLLRRLVRHRSLLLRLACGGSRRHLTALGQAPDGYIDFSGVPPSVERPTGIAVFPDFISAEEEAAWVAEVEPLMRRRRYESDHWDAVITGYRELQRPFEKLAGNPTLQSVISRVAAHMPPAASASKGTASSSDASPVPLLPFVHVLDLAAEGVIRPHVDSVKFSGCAVAGVCLLSDAVMTLTPDVAGDGYGMGGVTGYGAMSKEERERDALQQHKGGGPGNPVDPALATAQVRIFLPRRSFYWITGPARYNWGHSVLAGPQTVNERVPVVKDRRISLIFRDPLPPEEASIKR